MEEDILTSHGGHRHAVIHKPCEKIADYLSKYLQLSDVERETIAKDIMGLLEPKE